MTSLKDFFKIFYEALENTINHDGVEHAGYLAFLAILSIFPFLVFMFAIAGFVGETQIGIRFADIFLDNDIIPDAFIDALKPRVDEIVSGPPQSLLTIAIVGAIWTSSSMVEGIRTVLNRAYRVGTPPSYIWRRMLSIAQFLILTAVVIGVTFILIVAPNVWEEFQHFAYVQSISDYFKDAKISISPLLHHFRYPITVFVLLITVIITYYTLPNIKQSWVAVVPGAILVVLLWFFAGFLFAKYLSNFDQVHLIYGSLAGFIAAILFFYISAMILIYGAEFNYLFETSLGHKIEEKEHVEEETDKEDIKK